LPADAVAATQQPWALAIWIASPPTPPAPAWTSTRSPGSIPPSVTSACHALQPAIGTAAAYSKLRFDGIGRTM